MRMIVSVTRIRTIPAIVTVFAAALALGFGSGAMAAGTVNVGLSTALSGPAAAFGIGTEHGIALAIDKLNSEGGLLGKKVKLLTADGQLRPSTGATNVRSFVLRAQVKAIFGPVSSAAGIAEVQLATRYRVPIFLTLSSDIALTGSHFSRYVFQVGPTTYMEPNAVALYVAKLAKQRNWKTIYTISPNYSFGHDYVDAFLKGLKRDGAHLKVVGQQWPPLGASDFTSYASVIASKKPDFLFVGLYGGDLITFTKQASGFGLFKETVGSGMYFPGTLHALGAAAPVGTVVWDRVPPFHSHATQEIGAFVKMYHKKFDKWPNIAAVLGYSGVETWAQGVKKAGSFDADKVSAALSGATVHTVLGKFRLRACDHVAEVPEYLGLLSNDVDPKSGARTMTNVFKAPPDKIMMSCEQKKAMRGK